MWLLLKINYLKYNFIIKKLSKYNNIIKKYLINIFRNK
jgi:hypothetical protein